MAAQTRRLAIMLGMTCLGPAAPSATQAAVVTPGQTVVSTLPSSTIPLALGYDTQASTLYAVTQDQSSGTLAFGSIDPSRGTFTPVGGAIGNLFGGIAFSIRASNSINGSAGTALILRTDGLLSVDLKSGATSIGSAPGGVSALGYDFQAPILYGRSSEGVVAVSASTGAQTVVASYAFGGGEIALASTVDPYRGLFYVEEEVGTTAYLDAINEKTGAISRVALATPLIGLAFDVSNKASSSGLYGVTSCSCGGSQQGTNYLVRVSPSGGLSKIAAVGDQSTSFPATLQSSLDPDDSFFATSSLTGLVWADTTVDRSWYVERLPSEAASALDAWMTSAGQALAARAFALPSGRTIISILDFGQPSETSKGVFGAVFAKMQFQSTAAIQNAVLAFAGGWHAGLNGNAGPALQIVVGTNNKIAASLQKTGNVQGHGHAWAVMMSKIASALAAAYGPAVNAIAGLDIELMYSSPTVVASWRSGFGSNEYVDFGNAPGCPQACGYGWKATDVLSFGGRAFIPEIYSPNAPPKGNAAQWAGLSTLNDQINGAPLNIVAPLSELAACIQRAPDCTKNGRTNASPARAWILMTGALQGAVAGSAAMIGSATNIEHRVP